MFELLQNEYGHEAIAWHIVSGLLIMSWISLAYAAIIVSRSPKHAEYQNWDEVESDETK